MKELKYRNPAKLAQAMAEAMAGETGKPFFFVDPGAFVQTFLGVEVPGFPNMFMLMGPHTALGNIPRSIEHNVEWVTGLIKHMRERKLTRAECKVEAAKEWTDHVIRIADGLLSMEIDSWMTGINRNVEGKDTRSVARYTGSAPAYRERADAVAGKLDLVAFTTYPFFDYRTPAEVPDDYYSEARERAGVDDLRPDVMDEPLERFAVGDVAEAAEEEERVGFAVGGLEVVAGFERVGHFKHDGHCACSLGVDALDGQRFKGGQTHVGLSNSQRFKWL